MDKLEVVLTEYRELRNELLDKFRFHIQIFSIYLSVLLIFFGLIFVHKIYDIVLILPLFAFTLFLRFLHEQLAIHKICNYIEKEIENWKIPLLIGKIENHEETKISYKKLWMAYQNYWKDSPTKTPSYFQASTVLIFLVFSVIPSLIYNSYIIINIFRNDISVSKIPITFLIIILTFNLLIGLYIIYKIGLPPFLRKPIFKQ